MTDKIYTIKEKVTSVTKREVVWANPGDYVRKVSSHDNAVIVEKVGGDSFATNIDNLKISDWIENTEMPKKKGCYKILTHYGEYEAFVSSNTKGELLWVIPDGTIITHYKKK